MLLRLLFVIITFFPIQKINAGDGKQVKNPAGNGPVVNAQYLL